MKENRRIDRRINYGRVLPRSFHSELVKRLHGHLWSFPAQPVLGPCFSTGFGTTVIDRPRVPTAYGGRDAGGMGGFVRVTRAKARA